ncbi:alkaline phosphatase D family protein [Sphingomonas sp. PB2P12]|uniref:alkaline phosphatase D family protein n=1 Tax=Sphingomonas sandaracina TaxID=3096157 RepID=UPI002FC984ED
MTFPSFDRRRFLAGAAIGAPALLLHGRAFAATDPFSLGVASGEPEPDGFVIWTRIAPNPLAEDGLGGNVAPMPVRWEVSTDDAFRHIVVRGEAVAQPALASAVHVEVAGLKPDRPYWYRFLAAGTQSPVGRAWTAPAITASPAAVRFTAATCSHWEMGYFSAYRHMAAEEDSRFTLFLGDYIYEDSASPERLKQAVRSYGMGPAQTLADYRRRYALHRTDRDLQRLHAAAPCIATWDDHEVQNDYSGIWSQDPAFTPAQFVLRRLTAYRAFCENMPVRLSRVMRGDTFRLNRRFRWGDLAQFDVLDGRQFRSPPACIDGQKTRRGHMAPISCADLADPSRTFLGFEQERWLYDGWAKSAAHWNLLVQNLLVAPLVVEGSPEPLIWTDTWNGFGGARTRLLDAMVETKLSNPVTLAGDYHSFWCNDLRQRFDRPSDPAVAAEIVVSSITSNGPPDAGIRAALPANPHIRYFDATHRGYLSVDLHRDRMDARCMAISDRADRAATVGLLHAVSVEAGRPGVA